ncbi:hypothetical protein PRIPAC_74887 [Pristionchus pacificus]|uniref:Uncharacterized protein n=1 Tax=Pristionchus pacificus TaxID=54126 RepID=A0A2A6BR93_PRIPA|nr:hypothetical protein PRIPAC_74887 [Pristionchus pacificus]|eukprot:PDM68472.1 hypothetical protein PRIPAC_43974 [Pristionchus pacificus]
MNDGSSDEDRRHRRKHKKRSHRRRSRSSSSSPTTSSALGNSIHINPIVANTFADAQMLQQRVAAQDVQIHHIGAELTSAHARINVLEGQLARLSQEKQLLEARCTPLEQQNTRLIEQLDETKKVLQVLEPAVTSYQKTNDNLTRERNELATKEKVAADECKAAKAAYLSAKEQAEFVGKRNEVLAKKCEDVLVKNKQLEEHNHLLCAEADRFRSHAEGLAKAITELKRRAELAENEKSLLAGEKRALLDREGTWRAEKADMEKKILYKESQIRSQKRAHDDEMHAEKDRFAKLETKCRENDAGFASEAAVNSVKMAVDVLRASMEDQINMMRRRIGDEIDIEVIKQSMKAPSSSNFLTRIRSPSPVDRKRKK